MQVYLLLFSSPESGGCSLSTAGEAGAAGLAISDWAGVDALKISERKTPDSAGAVEPPLEKEDS